MNLYLSRCTHVQHRADDQERSGLDRAAATELTVRLAPRSGTRQTQGRDGSLLLSYRDSFIPDYMPVYPSARVRP